MAPSVSILIADDFEPWRLMLRHFFQTDPRWRIVWEACDGQEAVDKSLELRPELILLDICMPRLNGIEAARRIAEWLPGTKILFVSENRDPEVVLTALRAGAQGYVVKSDLADELAPALDRVMTGRHYVGGRFSTIKRDWELSDKQDEPS